MRFEPLSIHGATLVHIEPHPDSRGFFARVFCADEFRSHGLAPAAIQSSISYNTRRGTVRGIHFQWPPSTEAKLVRCIRGELHDVLVDLRSDSPSYMQHVAVRLTQDNRDAVFIPHGVAHAFQTLCDHTEVLYQMTDVQAPALASGFRWNDAAFGIRWPIVDDIVISDRDANYPDFDRQRFEAQLRQHQTSTAAHVTA